MKRINTYNTPIDVDLCGRLWHVSYLNIRNSLRIELKDSLRIGLGVDLLNRLKSSLREDLRNEKNKY